jgi:CheY-like chemotaxis protein
MAQIRHFTPAARSILVVEDRGDVRQGLLQLFDLYGYDASGVATGEEALAMLNAAPREFGLVLLDLALAGRLSGFDVRKRLLADPHLAQLPTVVITGCEPPAAERAALRTDGWVEKPFRFDALRAVIDAFVQPTPAAARPGTFAPTPAAPRLKRASG